MLVIQFVLDGILHDILDDWSPAGHLIRLLRDALLPGYGVDLLARSLKQRER